MAFEIITKNGLIGETNNISIVPVSFSRTIDTAVINTHTAHTARRAFNRGAAPLRVAPIKTAAKAMNKPLAGERDHGFAADGFAAAQLRREQLAGNISDELDVDLVADHRPNGSPCSPEPVASHWPEMRDTRAPAKTARQLTHPIRT